MGLKFIIMGIGIDFLVFEVPMVDNIVGASRFTRNGQIFAPPQLSQDSNVDALAKAKGKQVVIGDQVQCSTPEASSSK